MTRLASRRQINDEEKEAYLKARLFWNTPDDLRRSIEYFHRAIERDPDYPPAWTGLAEAPNPPLSSRFPRSGSLAA